MMKQSNLWSSAKSTSLLLLSFLLTLLPLSASAQCPDNHHPHMIDLGLPSGTKWSCCNMGADTPEAYGGYFSWGETKTKNCYDFDSYEFFLGWSYYPWYENIGRDICRTEYDVAYTQWGDSWQMPKKEQMQELIDNCLWQWTTQNGVTGMSVTGKNGNSIFLPASSARWGTDSPELGQEGVYWSSELQNTDSSTPWILSFSLDALEVINNRDRCCGMLVRPVTPKVNSGYPEVEGGWLERVTNGNLEGSDTYSFGYYTYPPNISANMVVEDQDDATNHCIKMVRSNDFGAADFILAITKNGYYASLYPSQKYKFSMRVKASQPTQVQSRGQNSYGGTICDGILGTYDVTTEWTTVSVSGVVTDEQAGLARIGFLFNDPSPVEYYFDDISFQVETGDRFTAKTEEGSELIFTVISEDERTCLVGDLYREDGIHLAMTDIYTPGKLTLPATVEHKGKAYSLKFVGDGAFASETYFDNIIMPEGLTYVGNNSFWINPVLKSLTLPSTLKRIGLQAFYSCYNLEDVFCYVEDPIAIEETVFMISSNTYNGFSKATLYVPAASRTKYETADGWSLFTNIVGIGTESEPGAYAALSDDDSVLTFYYDNNRASRHGMNIRPFAYNQSTGSINSGWYRYRENIKTVVFDESFANCNTITSTAYWFQCPNLTTITGLENLNTSHVTDMTGMFSGCSNLTSLDLSHFDTGNVTNMGGMFYGCKALTSLDLSHFDTGNVTNMGSMFSDCYMLKNVCLNRFNTANLTEAACMFMNCQSLTNLDLSSFNTANLENIAMMFYNCFALSGIYVDENKWSTAKMASSWGVFWSCTSLVGGNGTAYDGEHYNEDYAHIDEAGNPGYLTNIKSLIPIEEETTINTENLDTENLTDNVVDDVYYNVGSEGYDDVDGSIVINETTDMGEIGDATPGSNDIANNFTGLILKVAKGKGSVTVNVKTSGNSQLVVQVGDDAPTIATRTERGDVVIDYNVKEDTYIYIYTVSGSSSAPLHRTASDDLVKIYGITIIPVLIGDVNGDGKVTITDAVAIVNHMMGIPVLHFDERAADVSDDNNITFNDAVGVLNIMMNASK